MKSALVLGALLLAGCSDNTTPADFGPKPDLARADQRLDAPVDLGVDLASELGVDLVSDAPRELASADAALDLAPKDLLLADLGAPNLSGTISRSVAPVLDAKGNVYVVLSLFPPPLLIQGAGTVLQGVHLVSTSTKVSYAMSAPPGTYSLYAFLDDNSNAVVFPAPMPDAVDLVSSQVPQVKIVAGQPLKLDFVLDTIGGFVASDAGMGTMGALKGTVKASVSPALDGKGTLYVTLHNQLPPGGQVSQSGLSNADLSSPFAEEMYYLGNAPPGSYYLRVFLDDNANAKPLSLAPDKGDLVHSSPIQVHVIAGTVTSYNVVLDKVQP